MLSLLLLLLALAAFLVAVDVSGQPASEARGEPEMLKPEPRVASLKHILRLHKLMDMYASSGLQMLQNIDKLASLNLRIGCETGKWPDPMPTIPADLVVACLCVATDEEHYQITAGEFITANKPVGL